MKNETIVAPLTAPGHAAISVIRLSGPEAIAIAEKLFDKTLAKVPSHSIHFGTIKDGDEVVDEALVSVFRAPNSYTGEDVTEISCHGSPYIVLRILELSTANGARMAQPGEFTQRAFLNRKMDLSQAEAVADVIASESAAAHRIAMHQMRGGFAKEIADLREKLVHFASLVELELDFSEEDVEFADRSELTRLLEDIDQYITGLIDSFRMGNVIREGIPVVIAGKPNVGKSTLLNALLKEEKAIVSDIAGTTRDVIEDVITLDGITYRFMDTAGLRETDDKVESIGVARTLDKLQSSAIVLYVFDASSTDEATLNSELQTLNCGDAKVIPVGNKADLGVGSGLQVAGYRLCLLSAKTGEGMEDLIDTLKSHSINIDTGGTVLTNARHADALRRAKASITSVQQGLDSQVSGDLLATDIRQALHHLGEITGEVTADDLLGNIFSRFCIGK